MAVNTKAFEGLIRNVQNIDPAAARWLTEVAPKNGCVQCGDLTSVMNWRETPQGWEYWDQINSQLELQKGLGVRGGDEQ